MYQIEEDTNVTAPMRAVYVNDDFNNRVYMFAARFEKTVKPQRSTLELQNDPEYITVYTEERYIKGTAARIIKRKTLHNIVERQCEIFRNGQCDMCFTDKQELEEGCLLAWKLTIGKGKALKY
ncbi:hypothetical protein GRF59_14990 [Paenibacillus sp. HJL G12]|uniref:Uncharacterized protein n=1 Tax=Paenibacillus dendrobii TaxID=2691084 RepID=A0A7X3IKA7_9BACL|nr:hypothetical protein [Paenibacillus dendrobii]MWV44926.1 hypothetical protein [Paenibacillus dendrobii]